MNSFKILFLATVASYAMDLPFSAHTKKLYVKDFPALGVHYSNQLVIDESEMKLARVLPAVPSYRNSGKYHPFCPGSKKRI